MNLNKCHVHSWSCLSYFLWQSHFTNLHIVRKGSVEKEPGGMTRPLCSSKTWNFWKQPGLYLFGIKHCSTSSSCSICCAAPTFDLPILLRTTPHSSPGNTDKLQRHNTRLLSSERECLHHAMRWRDLIQRIATCLIYRMVSASGSNMACWK